jgi:peptidyl-prolyl cis-trans isomerase A (cyclophilin A)
MMSYTRLMPTTLTMVPLLILMSGCGNERGTSNDAGASVTDAAVASSTYQVEFVTTAGNFTMEIDPSWSPNGEARFRELVDADFYEGCRFFRVVPGFVVQFGLNGTPSLNSAYAAIDDDPVVGSNTRARVSFAKSNSPNSRTTQLFISFSDNAFLDSMGFSAIGEVVSGMDSVDAINAEYTDSPSQSRISSEGNSYLDTNFPNLDYIETTTILE